MNQGIGGIPAHSHDQELQRSAELGVAGTLIWTFFFEPWPGRALKGFRNGRGYAVALGVAALAIAVQSFTDRQRLHVRGVPIALLSGLCVAGVQDESDA